MTNNSYLKPYLQPAFLICVGILAASAAGLPAIERVFGLYLRKEPIPLKNSLDSLDQALLDHYKVKKFKIQYEDVVKTLGTENYIQWTLEDTNVPPESHVRYCTLFITYYDLPDNVPHVPEECYIGGGNVELDSEGINLPVEAGDFDKTIPVKYIVFGRREGPFMADVEVPVCYLIYTDGVYTNSREAARLVLNKNIFSKYSYFSKVEWNFFNVNQFSMIVYPDREETVQASKRLLAVILPALEKDHWPDWEK
jgi:hypothetical protein